ncbi:MAG TPA: shikimate dehydrogenase, partial [Acidimicrobiia bacterium]|nr:shikimate dehydrogenase [Acidimicrobiia bacterium]
TVNTVTPLADGRLSGESTDGPGFLRALRDAGHEVRGATALVLGAGGAARAVAHALGAAGARVTVCARRDDAARVAAVLGHGATVAWGERAAAAAAATVVVNATPVGMGDGSRDAPLPVEALHQGQVVADLVYHPLETALLAGARERGADVVDGLGMLVHQAALQVERWTGEVAPVAVMRAAAIGVLRPAR